MHGQTDRVEQFKQDIAELRIHDPSTSRDQLATNLGLAAMAAGVGLAILAYFLSHGTTNPLAQRDALAVGLIGVTLTVAGGVLYLKGALAGFLRFWLLRDLHERRAQTDRLLGALDPGGDRRAEGEPS